MNKLTQKIKFILEEIKKEQGIKPKKKDFCIIQLTFGIEDFYRKCDTIGEFLKKLRNNKNSLSPLVRESFRVRSCRPYSCTK